MSAPNLPLSYQPAFFDRWEHRIQREVSLFKPFVRMTDVDGYQKKLDQIEKQSMRKTTSRHANTTQDEVDLFIRWLKTNKYELSNILDEWDEKELGSLILPDGQLVENHAFAYNRACDTEIRDAIEGNAYTGEDGATLTAVPSSQIVAATFTKAGTAVNSGLTFDKVARALKIFQGNAVRKGKNIAGAISAIDEEDLVVNVAEIRNSDFSKVAPIENGTVDGTFWMGVNWIVCDDDLLTTASNITNCLFWHKDKVYFGDGQRRANIDILPEKSHAIQIRTRARMGAARFEEKGVVLVKTYHA